MSNKMTKGVMAEYRKLEQYYAVNKGVVESKPLVQPSPPSKLQPQASVSPAIDERTRIESMARSGVRRVELARYLGIKDEELERRYGKILDRIEIESNMEVSQALKDSACEGNVKAAELWLLNKDGWRRTPEEGAAGTCKLAIQINLGDIKRA